MGTSGCMAAEGFERLPAVRVMAAQPACTRCCAECLSCCNKLLFTPGAITAWAMALSDTGASVGHDNITVRSHKLVMAPVLAGCLSCAVSGMQ